ncbi:MAG: hypothetical protein A3K19_16235 [Lentisphaerae bacterium RIFOXYB12_FULL_65_16]|nr:MAG: hypothetical protein A3K18_11755 [Lentisphaerae bacterium RIFOXYA12_64_32]OGV90174.1 MAG: hypothetical protein A3K19_16235 [Lentisphaerae bacterium RIFOXYB12_FULL_65_16]
MATPEEKKPEAEAQPQAAPAKLAVKQIKSKGELLRFAATTPAAPPPSEGSAAASVAREEELEAEAEVASTAPDEGESEAAESGAGPVDAPAVQAPKSPVVTGKGELLRFAPTSVAAPEEGQASATGGAAAAPSRLKVADEKPQPKRLALPDKGEKESAPSLADKLPKRIKVTAPADPLDAAIGRRPARLKAREQEEESRAPVGRGTKMKRRMHAVEESNKTTRLIIGMGFAALLTIVIAAVFILYTKKKPEPEMDILQMATQPVADETDSIPMETRQAVWKEAWTNEARATKDAEAQYPMNAKDDLKDTREQGMKRQRYKERQESTYNFETAKKHGLGPGKVDAIVQAGLRKGWKVPTEAELGISTTAVAAKPEEGAASETDKPVAVQEGGKAQGAAGAVAR